MTIITKYDYCQQCHALKTICRCDSEVKVVQVDNKQVEQEPIFISTWEVLVGGFKKKVSGIVVKGQDVEAIKKDSIFLSRVKRELKLTNKSSLSVLSVVLDKQLG